MLKIAVFVSILALLGFFLLSLAGGGDRFRLMGSRVQKESARIAETADSIHKSAKRIREKARDSMDRTQGVINALSGEDREKGPGD